MLRYDYFRPTTLTEAVDLLFSLRGNGLIIAGGTDIIPLINTRVLGNRSIVDVKSIPELSNFSVDKHGDLHIGAATCITNLLCDPLCQSNSTSFSPCRLGS